LSVDFLERVWAFREETLYPSLFGSESRGIFPITVDMLVSVFRQETYDPRWLTCGVFEFAPTATRSSWLYVTSGMSNDWDAELLDATTPSGLGVEFIFESSTQGDWAIMRLLHLMTFQILLCHGRFEGKEPLGVFDRLPLRSSIRPEPSDLQFLMLAPPSVLPASVQLESGSFNFLEAVGITEAEAAFGRKYGGDVLLRRLTEERAFPITNPARQTVSLHET